MSRLLHPLRRSPTPLATLLVALAVGVASATSAIVASHVRLGAPRVVVLALAFALASAAVVLSASGLIWGSRSAALSHTRVGLSSALLLAWQAIDAIHYSLFRRHVDEAALQLGWEAVRSKTLRFGAWDLIALCSATLVSAVLIAYLHAALSYVPCGVRTTERLRRLGAFTLLAGVLGALFRDRLWNERHTDAHRLSQVLAWSADGAAVGVETRAETGWGSDHDARTLAELRRVRQRITDAPLAARERPDLLIVHVESLRWDVFDPAHMPRLSQLAAECWVSPHHYSTGNSTGQSVFGLVTGLGGFLYSGARLEPGPALPLVALGRLGYRRAVHLANNLAQYDKIFDVVFQGGIDETYTAPEGVSYGMDLAVIEHYLRTRRSADAPRFDYVVLDSTHYDYSYPPEYERHTPSGTLGLGVRDALIVEEGINDRLRARASLVKNRYLNAVEWVDTLVGKLIDGLRGDARGKGTWFAVVGDHGEAFWEHGTFGHGMGLEDEQVRVPLVLCDPKGFRSRYAYSSHADLFPTWFDQMGVSGAPGPFMTGRSLADYRADADVAVTGVGSTSAMTSPRFLAAGQNLKVTFENTAHWPILAVHDTEDRRLPATPDAAYTVLAQALGTKLLRSPAAP